MTTRGDRDRIRGLLGLNRKYSDNPDLQALAEESADQFSQNIAAYLKRKMEPTVQPVSGDLTMTTRDSLAEKYVLRTENHYLPLRGIRELNIALSETAEMGFNAGWNALAKLVSEELLLTSDYYDLMVKLKPLLSKVKE